MAVATCSMVVWIARSSLSVPEEELLLLLLDDDGGELLLEDGILFEHK